MLLIILISMGMQGFSQDIEGLKVSKFGNCKLLGIHFSRESTTYSDNYHKHVFAYSQKVYYPYVMPEKSYLGEKFELYA